MLTTGLFQLHISADQRLYQVILSDFSFLFFEFGDLEKKKKLYIFNHMFVRKKKKKVGLKLCISKATLFLQ